MNGIFMMEKIILAFGVFVFCALGLSFIYSVIDTNVKVNEIHKFLGLHPDYPKGHKDEDEEKDASCQPLN